MFYYEIGVGADRHWGNSVFTYSSKNRLAKGSVVRIEFGKQKKNGLVLKQITKPDFNTKDVVFELNSKINEPTLRFIDWFAADPFRALVPSRGQTRAAHCLFASLAG